MNTIICLMGPTASGKTPLAMELSQRYPCEIISVDSAMVYRGMDIGTAKPTARELDAAPHRLIDLLDPAEIYSAGQFRADALREIDDIIAAGKVPLLVGGTMLYFRVLQQGLARMPAASQELRQELQERADLEGWEALHAFLAGVDPEAAARIQPRDTQRIQRALEVYLLTGKPISVWQQESTESLSAYRVHNIGLAPMERDKLHQRIAQRLENMFVQGFVEEVERLRQRGDLSPDLPSIRSVGYRQIWDYLAGKITHEEMREQALAATRQLAKRQMTWLRPWPELNWLDADAQDVLRQAEDKVARIVDRHPD